MNVSEVAGRYVSGFARLDPCRASAMGIAGVEGSLTDYAPEGVAARADLAARALRELHAAPDAPGVAGRVLAEWLGAEVASAEAGVTGAELNCVSGPVQMLRQAVELADQGEATVWEALLSRVAGLPAALAGLAVSVRGAVAAGRGAPRRQVEANVAQARRTAGYLAGLPGRAPDGPVRAALEGAVRAANAAWAEFAVFLEREVLPGAGGRDAVGRDRYELAVRRHLGTRLDLEETYAWGWAELARIDAEMAGLAGRIAPGEPVPAVLELLDADPRYRVGDGAELRGLLQELADRAVAELDGTHFDVPGPLRRIDCRISPTGAGGVYYLAPAEDLSRPGQVWWTVPEGGAGVATWTVPAVMYHEGVPGHHLQLGATVLNGSLDRFRRVAAELHAGWSEGWGLYAERLMDELGFYRDPAHALGMLAGGQKLRAARVVLDIGLHLELPVPGGGGRRWDRESGVAFLRSQVPDDDVSVAFEVDRYLGMPGQALAYKVGERVWLAGRDAARRRLGEEFSLRGFHRAALELGPMGLDLLAERLAVL